MTETALTFTLDPKNMLAMNVAYVANFSTGVMVTARKRLAQDSIREWRKAPRIYGALDVLVPELMATEPHTDKHIPLKPETDADRQAAKEWTAWKRNITRVARERLVPILSALIDAPVDPKDLKFSVTAGCKCPCSPGFIFSGLGMGRVDLWLETLTPEYIASMA